MPPRGPARLSAIASTRDRGRRHTDHGPLQGVVRCSPDWSRTSARDRVVERGADGARLRIATSLGAEIGLGDSVAVNGVCLTATGVDARGFATEAMNQTLAVTALGALETGARVNLELAMRAADRLGGHIVQGHADGVGTVLAVAEDGFARRLRVGLAPGAAALRGRQGLDHARAASASRRRLGDDWVEVSLIPETLERTNLGAPRPGDRLNVECRHRRQVRGALGVTIRWKGASVSQTTDDQNQEQADDRDGREPLRDDRGSDRGDPPRPHGRRLRRRGPRERGRPGDGGPVRHPRGGQLHGQGGARADLPGADRRSAASSSA